MKASGGTLDLKYIVNSGVSLRIDTTPGSDLKIETAATAANAISITSATQTLEIGPGGGLTISAAENVTSGTIKLDGGTLTVTGVLTLGTASQLTGFGKVQAAVKAIGATPPTISASGGTLELTSTLTDSGYNLAVIIGGGASDRLLLDGASAATSVAFAGSASTLEIAAAGSLTIGAAETIGSGTIKLDGATLTDAAGISLGSGALLIGSGTVAAPLSGSGSVRASAGTLDLTGTVSSGPALTIDAAAGSDLKIDGTATAAGAIAIGSTNQTLEIGAAGNLTISAVESITSGRIQLDGGTLTDAAGITIGSGASLVGSGTVAAPLSGSGTVNASGGTLDLTGTVSSGPVLAIDHGNLLIDGTATAASAIAISNGTLVIGTAANLVINAVESLTNGWIGIKGGTLTDASGIAIGSEVYLAGHGTVSAPLSGSGLVFASDGELDLTGTVSSGLTLAINTTAGSDLKIDGTATTGNAISISNNNQTLEIGATGALTITAAESITNGNIQLDGGTLADAAGLTVGNGAVLSGRGTVTAPLSGSGQVKASGGTLDLKGTVTSGPSLRIDTTAGSDLKIDGTATAANAISITSATQTLEVGATGSLTISAAESISNGKVQLDGGTLITTGALTLGTASQLTGFGKVQAAVKANGATAPTITAAGGTLELTSTLTDPGNSLAITIGAGAADKLLLDGASTAASVAFAGSASTLEIAAAGSLTISAAETIGSGTIKLDGATVTDAAGISLGSGALLIGSGTVAAPLSGNGLVKASGGTLDLTGTVSGGPALTIDDAAGSDLKIDGTATAAGAIAIGSANQTLEIGTAGNLTISAVESITSGRIQLDGGTLADAPGITIGSGALLVGSGTVAAPLSGSGTIKASGGTLDLTGTVSGGPVLAVDTTAGSNLKIDGTAIAVSAIGISSANQTLEVGSAANLSIAAAESVTSGTIQLDGGTLSDTAGLAIGSGALLVGIGTVAAPLSGSGTVRASSGMLDLTGTVSSGLTLAINTTAGSDLKIDGTATTGNAISISNNNQTLEIGATGALTITAAESITNGNIQLDGGTLADATGLTVGNGAVLSGRGTVTAPLSGSGQVKASGGTLDLKGTVTSGPSLRIGHAHRIHRRHERRR